MIHLHKTGTLLNDFEKSLVNRYQPDVIWSDGEWDQSDTTWRSREFLSWLYNNSPVKNTVVTNDRWGGDRHHGGFTTTEYGKGSSSLTRPWEECRGIGESFGFNRNENLEQYQTSKQLIEMLIDVVSRGGNLLLNIGPAADGTIPVIMQQRLKDMGDWLKLNGEAIYQTSAWRNAPSQKEKNIYYTKKGNDLYVLLTNWEKQILVPNTKASRIVLLGSNQTVSFSKQGNSIKITAPMIDPANNPSPYAWVYKVSNAF